MFAGSGREQTRLHPHGQSFFVTPGVLHIACGAASWTPPEPGFPWTVWKLLGIINLEHLLSDPTSLFRKVGVGGDKNCPPRAHMGMSFQLVCVVCMCVSVCFVGIMHTSIG